MSSKKFPVAVLLCGFITLLTLGLSGCGSSSNSIGVAFTNGSTHGIDQGQTVSITATVTNDSKSAGVTWTVSGGGTLSATTTTSATYNAPASVTSAFTATVTATSVTDTTKSATLQITVSALPAITITSLPAATAGVGYSQKLSESGGTSPYNWNITGGALPPGLSMVIATGVISGTPTTIGSNSATFEVTDSSAGGKTSSAPQAITITVSAPPPLSITTTTLPAATIGTPYTAALNATGGIPAYTWSVTAGSLPAGLTLSSAGLISGTPAGTSASTASFTVTVTDSQTPTPNTQSAGLSIAVAIATLKITTTSLPAAIASTSYTATVNATGGVPSYTWGLSGNPSWLSINPTTGVLSGTAPATAGTTPTFSVTVTDSESPTQESVANFTITINAAVACTGTDNNLLKGNYALLLNGWSGATAAYSSAGSFTADGAGHISGGLLDVSDQRSASGPGSGTFTGTYCVGSNNLATINLTYGGGLGGTGTFEAALDASDGNGHIISYDSDNAKVSGLLRKQQTTPFSTSEINGNYAFGLVGADPSANRFAVAGEFNSSGHGSLSGEDDSNDNGTLQTEQTFTASDFSVASNGRGTATIAFSTGNTNFVFYVVSASELLMMAVDTETPPTIQAGQVLLQSGTFADASLDGVSVMGFEDLDMGNTPATPEAQAGLITVTSPGSFTATVDDNDGGVMTSVVITGDYNVLSNGRMTLSNVTGCTGGCGTQQPVFYLVGPNQGFLVGTDVKVDFGTLTPQTGSSFDASSLSGNYLGGSQPPVSANVDEEVDYVNAAGGTLTGISDKNGSGGPSSSAIDETYVVSSNGRVVVSQSGVEQLILYIISTSQVVALPTTSNNPYLTDFHQ
ncbi:MAG: putative Ig domain-containing protein [Terriglobales bacterium]|jgi:hypothetical protein